MISSALYPIWRLNVLKLLSRPMLSPCVVNYMTCPRQGTCGLGLLCGFIASLHRLQKYAQFICSVNRFRTGLSLSRLMTALRSLFSLHFFSTTVSISSCARRGQSYRFDVTMPAHWSRRWKMSHCFPAEIIGFCSRPFLADFFFF